MQSSSLFQAFVEHLLGDAVLNDGGAVELEQAFSGQAVNQADDGLLAALGAESALLLLVVDHLLQPAGRRNLVGGSVDSRKSDKTLINRLEEALDDFEVAYGLNDQVLPPQQAIRLVGPLKVFFSFGGLKEGNEMLV